MNLTLLLHIRDCWNVITADAIAQQRDEDAAYARERVAEITEIVQSQALDAFDRTSLVPLTVESSR